MADLILDSLEISNFRTFRQLKIEQLGRVNLIVGKNSVGKTSLLEALWLYANNGSPEIIWNVLRERKELGRRAIVNSRIEDEDALISGLRHLFYGRKEVKYDEFNAAIGSAMDLRKMLRFRVGRQPTISQTPNNESQLSFDFVVPFINSSNLALSVSYLGVPNLFRSYALARGARSVEFEEQLGEVLTNNFIRPSGLRDADISDLWGNIALTDLEEEINQALQIIIPNIERVAIVNEGRSNFEHIVLVKTKGSDARVPLRSLGDGLNRVFGIVLSLVNSKDGMLLVDEIENGLHFSTQLGLWRLVFAIAHRLNVQVFATTHSWDCIEAFQQASKEDPELGMVIRLNNIDGEITSTLFDERRLSIVTREQIEVR